MQGWGSPWAPFTNGNDVPHICLIAICFRNSQQFTPCTKCVTTRPVVWLVILSEAKLNTRVSSFLFHVDVYRNSEKQPLEERPSDRSLPLTRITKYILRRTAFSVYGCTSTRSVPCPFHLPLFFIFHPFFHFFLPSFLPSLIISFSPPFTSNYLFALVLEKLINPSVILRIPRMLRSSKFRHHTHNSL
jgi:hypothetical protein